MEWYKRSWNSGFVTEIIAVDEQGTVAEQLIQPFHTASWPEGIPDLVSQPFRSLRGQGFRHITSQREIDALDEHYQSFPILEGQR